MENKTSNNTKTTTASVTTTQQQQQQQPTKKNPQRQAISGMIVTIILIGIVVSVGGILATTTTDLVSTGLVLETVEVKRLVIQNTQNSSFVSAMIKNNGNTDLKGAFITIQKDDGNCVPGYGNSSTNCGDADNTIHFGKNSDNANAITQSGESTTINAQLAERLPIGKKVIVTIQADVVGGGQYLTTKLVSPQ